MGLQRILFLCDDHPSEAAALELAGDLALAYGAELVFARALAPDPSSADRFGEELREAERRCHTLRIAQGLRGVRTSSTLAIRFEAPLPLLLDAIEQLQVDLAVVPGAGLAASVLDAAEIPVLLRGAPPVGRRRSPPRRLLCAFDPLVGGLGAIGHFRELGDRLGGAAVELIPCTRFTLSNERQLRRELARSGAMLLPPVDRVLDVAKVAERLDVLVISLLPTPATRQLVACVASPVLAFPPFRPVHIQLTQPLTVNR